jgi:transcriptional regulator with XRE-family HTH domain
MYLADRLHQLREAKNLSQGDIESRTGLLRCYVSRVENGHTVPSLETLEKLARAFEVPLHQIFYDGNEKPTPSSLPEPRHDWASRGKGLRMFTKICRTVSKVNDRDRKLLLHLAQKLASRPKRPGSE